MGDNFFPPRRDFCYLLVIFGLYVFVIHGRQFSGNIFLFLNLKCENYFLHLCSVFLVFFFYITVTRMRTRILIIRQTNI